jgi:hypothetical protein
MRHQLRVCLSRFTKREANSQKSEVSISCSVTKEEIDAPKWLTRLRDANTRIAKPQRMPHNVGSHRNECCSRGHQISHAAHGLSSSRGDPRSADLKSAPSIVRVHRRRRRKCSSSADRGLPAMGLPKFSAGRLASESSSQRCDVELLSSAVNRRSSDASQLTCTVSSLVTHTRPPRRTRTAADPFIASITVSWRQDAI